MTEKVMSNAEIDAILAQGRVEGDPEWSYQFGRWKCFSCEGENHGFVKNCFSCGAPKDEKGERSEYLSEGALYYNEELAGKLADLANPDWMCVHCNTSMSHRLQSCSNCGASVSDNNVEQVSYELGEEPHSADEALAGYDRRHQTINVQHNENNVPKLGLYSVVAITGLAGLLMIGLMYWLLFSTTVVNAKVTNLRWSRTVHIEQLITSVEEGTYLPPGAKLIRSQKYIRDYDEVPDGYNTLYREVEVDKGYTGKSYQCGKKDIGSGVWKTRFCAKEKYQVQKYKKVPNYDTKYIYENDHWVESRFVKNEGVGRELARMDPQFSLANREREGRRTETLQVELTDDKGKTYVYNLDRDKWEKVSLNQKLNLEFNALGMSSGPKFP